MHVRFCRLRAGSDFNPLAARRKEGVDHGVRLPAAAQTIAPGVRQNRKGPALEQKTHSLFQRGPGRLDVGGSALTQIAVEGLLLILDDARLQEPRGKVRARKGFGRIRPGKRPFVGARKADPLEGLAHLHAALGAKTCGLAKALDDEGILWTDAESHDVKHRPAPAYRKLDARNEGDSRLLRGFLRARTPRRRVVVRDGQERHARRTGEFDERLGSERAVGSVRMGVQIHRHDEKTQSDVRGLGAFVW